MKNIKDFASLRVNLRKVTAGEYSSPCPKCGGNDRFRIWPQRDKHGAFFCRGCDKGGDAITYLREYEGMSYGQACRELGIEARAPASGGLGTPHRTTRADFVPNTKGHPPEVVDVALWRSKALKFARESHEHLLTSAEIIRYLAGRGLDESVIKKFKVGFHPGGKDGRPSMRPWPAWGLRPEKTGKGRWKLIYRHRGIVIPWIVENEVHRLRIRLEKPEENQPRYWAVRGSHHGTMVLNSDARVFLVVESELDALMLTRFIPAEVGVVALGSASVKPDIPSTALLRGALKILVSLDADPAGVKGWKWWKSNFPNAARWPVPEGKDPGDAFEKGVSLAAWVHMGLPPALTVQAETKPAKTETKRPPVETNKPPGVPEGAPAELVELAGLLARHPVRINRKRLQLGLIMSEKWERGNWDISERISRLVFGPCMAYLDGHPADIVTGGNFWQGWKG